MTTSTSSPQTPAAAGDAPSLDRRLGPPDAAAIVVSNVIGGGIFFVPVLSGILVLSGSLSQLVSYTGFAVVLFSGIAVGALFVLRHREPDAPRPFRAWGYPWAPAIFVAASAAMVVNEMIRNGSTALLGLSVIALGVPVCFLFQRGR